MRITDGTLQRNALRDIQHRLRDLADAQRQVATGLRHGRLSEDPVAGLRVMRSDTGLRALEQYRRNTTAFRARLDAEEAVLGQVTDLVARAKELGLSEASAASSPQTRAAAAAELDRIIEQVVQLGNTQVGGEYIFGGFQVEAPPFDTTGAYAGDDGVRQVELGAGYVVPTVHSGRRLLVDSGVIASLQSLRGQLASGTPATIGASLTAVDDAFEDVQTLLAEVGARSRGLDAALANTDALESSYTLARSDAADIPIEEATTRFMSVQNTLQAALLATSRALDLSLTEYLR